MKSAAADGATKRSNSTIERKDFHFEYHALLRKIPSEIGPVSDLQYRKHLREICALEDAARDAFEIYSLIVRTTLEVGRVSASPLLTCLRINSS